MFFYDSRLLKVLLPICLLSSVFQVVACASVYGRHGWMWYELHVWILQAQKPWEMIGGFAAVVLWSLFGIVWIVATRRYKRQLLAECRAQFDQIIKDMPYLNI